MTVFVAVSFVVFGGMGMVVVKLLVICVVFDFVLVAGCGVVVGFFE